jgi:predicted patatin/cPLA2 family phospholipase
VAVEDKMFSYSMEKRESTSEEILKETLGMYKKLVQRTIHQTKTIEELKSQIIQQHKFIKTLEKTINDKL